VLVAKIVKEGENVMPNDLESIVRTRDSFKMMSDEWCKYDNMKIQLLETIKPSTTESCFYYYSNDIRSMPLGFVPATKLPDASLYLGTRSALEYNGGMTRHVIPYCVIACEDEYYFTVRVGGSEARLVGKIGCLGGHVGKEGIDVGMMRELQEEADLTENKIKRLVMKGFIKSKGDVNNPMDVDRDHLGLIYKITLRRKNIREEEAGVLKGIWIHKDDIGEYYDRMESWSQILVTAGIISG
jgi:predicted NUDIX family phosphoesterase